MADKFNTISALVNEAEKYATQAQADRIRATEYERGEMKDVPAEVDRPRLLHIEENLNESGGEYRCRRPSETRCPVAQGPA